MKKSIGKYWKFAKKVLDPILINTLFHMGGAIATALIKSRSHFFNSHVPYSHTIISTELILRDWTGGRGGFENFVKYFLYFRFMLIKHGTTEN